MCSRIGCLVAVIMVGFLLFTACSVPPASPATSGTTATSTKPYGSLMIGVRLEFHSLDPVILTVLEYTFALGAVFDQLVDPTPDGQPSPGLAERWEISPDGMSQTFYIRKGVKFHDGSDLTGEDVKFSMDRIMAPESTNASAVIWRSAIAKVELKDDYTVVVRMKTPQFEFLRGISDFGGASAVAPKKYIEEKGVDYFQRHPIGSGPFKLVKWEPGVRLELEAVENHWRAVPKFKNITMVPLPEEATKVAMLRTGELDLAPVAPGSIAGLKAAGLSVLRWDGTEQYMMEMFYDLDNPQKYAIGDVRVRKALSLAIDRKELANEILGGNAEPSALLYAPTKSFFFDPNVLKPDPYDPEGAKRLLAEAGYSNGFPTKLWNTTVGTIVETLDLALMGYWRKIGVNTEMVPVDKAVFRLRYMPKIDPSLWPSMTAQYSTGAVFGFGTMQGAFHSQKGYWNNVKNLELDKLIDKVPATLDPAEKKRIALQAAVMAKNEYNNVAILNILSLAAFGPQVGGWKPITGMVGLGLVLDTITHAK